MEEFQRGGGTGVAWRYVPQHFLETVSSAAPPFSTFSHHCGKYFYRKFKNLSVRIPESGIKALFLSSGFLSMNQPCDRCQSTVNSSRLVGYTQKMDFQLSNKIISAARLNMLFTPKLLVKYEFTAMLSNDNNAEQCRPMLMLLMLNHWPCSLKMQAY